MNINGLKVDAEKIGAGIYGLICEQGEEAIVAFGMIPLWAIEAAENGIREKIISIAAEQKQIPIEDFRPHVDETLLRETVQPIVHEIALAIYGAASKAGKLVV